MRLVGSGEQARRDYMIDASGTITAGGTAQLLLPQHQSRSFLWFSNNSSGNIMMEFGAARATCTLSGTVVNASLTVTNAGFNYTKPPVVLFLGGGYPDTTHGAARGHKTGLNTSYVGAGGPGFPSPAHPARAHATLSGGSVNAIVLDDPGAGYAVAPMVFVYNSDLDPNGAAAPSDTDGIIIAPGGSIVFNGTCCPTDPIAIFGDTTAQAFTCKFMT